MVPNWRNNAVSVGIFFLWRAHGPPSRQVQLLVDDSLPFVVLPFASCQADLDLGHVVLDVHAKWNDGQALLRYLADQASDFSPVEQQFSGPLGLVIVDISCVVGRYVPPEASGYDRGDR